MSWLFHRCIVAHWVRATRNAVNGMEWKNIDFHSSMDNRLSNEALTRTYIFSFARVKIPILAIAGVQRASWNLLQLSVRWSPTMKSIGNDLLQKRSRKVLGDAVILNKHFDVFTSLSILLDRDGICRFLLFLFFLFFVLFFFFPFLLLFKHPGGVIIKKPPRSDSRARVLHRGNYRQLRLAF